MAKKETTSKSHRTLDALRRAIGTTDGTDCSAFWLWASNDGTAGATAAIGDGDRLASALLALLNRVGEGRAMPQEMMLTRAVLMAVAAADVRNDGHLLEVIRQHRDAILSGNLKVTNGYGEDLLDDNDNDNDNENGFS